MRASAVPGLEIIAALTIAYARIPASLPASKIEDPIADRAHLQLAATCPKTGEQISGMNKICFYNCVASMTTITVSAVQLCPLSIQG